MCKKDVRKSFSPQDNLKLMENLFWIAFQLIDEVKLPKRLECAFAQLKGIVFRVMKMTKCRPLRLLLDQPMATLTTPAQHQKKCRNRDCDQKRKSAFSVRADLWGVLCIHAAFPIAPFPPRNRRWNTCIDYPFQYSFMR